MGVGVGTLPLATKPPGETFQERTTTWLAPGICTITGVGAAAMCVYIALVGDGSRGLRSSRYHTVYNVESWIVYLSIY